MPKLSSTQKLVRAGMLAALIMVLSLTPLGYIRLTSVLEITLMVIPVALGGLAVGWPVGTVLGLVFGVSSFIRAFTDPIGIIMIEMNLVLAGLACILPRVVVGLIADLFNKALVARAKLRRVWFYSVAGFVCSMCNTVLFLGFVWLAFDSAVTGFTLAVILGVVGTNGIVEMIANAVLVGILARVVIPSPGPGEPPPDDPLVKNEDPWEEIR
ncbi:ECF transporter S component [Ruminococcaceae bacterium OttesenSCG-928-D13]|nr:ECF transporter S component [Ruminococcaceae bacterium OttesenSCG-928-D13]